VGPDQNGLGDVAEYTGITSVLKTGIGRPGVSIEAIAARYVSAWSVGDRAVKAGA
jgi:hypothetical protein